jgi:hypothetical protein
VNKTKQLWVNSNVTPFRLATFAIGILLLTLGGYSLSGGLGAVYMFLGGFLFLTGVQLVTWSVGLSFEILGNVPAEYEYSQEQLLDTDLIDRSREAAQQLGELSREYYESSLERAGELYSQASDIYSRALERSGEAAAREITQRRVSSAIDAGRKAYQEEKRRTQLSGRIESAPEYKEKPN